MELSSKLSSKFSSKLSSKLSSKFSSKLSSKLETELGKGITFLVFRLGEMSSILERIETTGNIPSVPAAQRALEASQPQDQREERPQGVFRQFLRSRGHSEASRTQGSRKREGGATAGSVPSVPAARRALEASRPQDQREQVPNALAVVPAIFTGSEYRADVGKRERTAADVSC